jgi:hypothetical protein
MNVTGDFDQMFSAVVDFLKKYGQDIEEGITMLSCRSWWRSSRAPRNAVPNSACASPGTPSAPDVMTVP